jgi:tripartite-type tricarboxylate transporter receptor subunit TctC
MVVGTPTAHATAQFLYTDLPYDPIKDLDPVALIGNTYFVLAASTQLGVKTVKDLVDVLKARPGQLNFASSGEGGIAHLGGLIFSDITGTTATHVPYKSANQPLLDLVAGRVQYFFSTIPPAEPLAKSGKIRILAVAGPRQAALPDVPSMAEAGYPQLELKFWFAAFMPAQTPREIVARMNREINTVLKDPAVADPLKKQGVVPDPVSPEQLAAIVKKDAEMFRQVALKANFKKSSLGK